MNITLALEVRKSNPEELIFVKSGLVFSQLFVGFGLYKSWFFELSQIFVKFGFYISITITNTTITSFVNQIYGFI